MMLSLFIHPSLLITESKCLPFLNYRVTGLESSVVSSFNAAQKSVTSRITMASEGPSWADQWGAGGFGAMEDDNSKTNKDTDNKKAAGLGKAKAAAMAGAQKVKNGASSGMKWVKNMCQKKTTSS